MSPKNGLCLAFGDRMTRGVSIAFFSQQYKGGRNIASAREMGRVIGKMKRRVRKWEIKRKWGWRKGNWVLWE